jgi:hypothetical protein
MWTISDRRDHTDDPGHVVSFWRCPIGLLSTSSDDSTGYAPSAQSRSPRNVTRRPCTHDNGNGTAGPGGPERRHARPRAVVTATPTLRTVGSTPPRTSTSPFCQWEQTSGSTTRPVRSGMRVVPNGGPPLGPRKVCSDKSQRIGQRPNSVVIATPSGTCAWRSTTPSGRRSCSGGRPNLEVRQRTTVPILGRWSRAEVGRPATWLRAGPRTSSAGHHRGRPFS